MALPIWPEHPQLRDDQSRRDARHLMFDQPRIEAAAGQQRLVRAGLRPPSPPATPGSDPPPGSSTAGAPPRSSSGPPSGRPAPSAPPVSLIVSRCEVASSRISSGASFRNARAMAMRCRCPPDSCTPRSPTCVASPSGSPATNSASAARDSASAISARRRIGPGEADIRLQRVVEQVGVLRHQRDPPAQPVQRQIAADRRRPAG